MKRGKKLLLLLAVLAIAVGAAAAAAALFPDGEAEETAEEAETPIVSLPAEELASFGWTYDGETISFKKTDGGWQYEQDASFPVNETALSALFSAAGGVTAVKTIESPEDVAQYGLDDPACEIMAETESGESVWLRVGSETDMGGQWYVSTGDGNVYITASSLLDTFSVGLYGLVQEEDIPYMSDVSAFDVQSEIQTLSIVHLPDSGIAYSDRYEWFLSDGGEYRTLDTALTEDLVESVTMMSWASCVNYAADGDALAEYGLDSPAAVVTVSYTETTEVATGLTDAEGNTIYDTQESEKTFVLELGDYADSSYCYARLRGSRMVYTVSASVCDGLLYTDYDSLRPDEVLAVDWNGVTGIDIQLDDAVYALEKELVPVEDGDGEEESGDAEATEYETAWFFGGTRVEAESCLGALTSLSVSGYADGTEPSRSEELRLVIHQSSDTHPEIELVFYQYDSASCLAVLNGETVMLTPRDGVTSLTDSLAALFDPSETEDTPDASE